MQKENRTPELLKKYILNQCTKAEVKEVIKYFQKITNSDQLPTVQDVLKLLKEKPILEEVEANKIHNTILEIASKEKNTVTRKKFRIWKYAAAAAVIGIISTTLFFKEDIFKNENNTPVLVNTQIQPGTDKATLTLEDGATIALTKGTKYQTKNAESNGEEIVYTATNNQQPTTSKYNILTIPRGGQFQITLSDGTKVWLNSESQIKYPVAFNDGETRQVELVYGEAYFDVSPSTEHNGTTFQVINKEQNVEVLGTEFNMKAYKDETTIYTTLIEGKVAINYSNNKKYLIPNQQSTYDTTNNTFKINTVEVYNEIAWKEGIFSFEDKKLEEIMKVLSRWYDMDVIFGKPELKSVEFLGKLKKKQRIEEILSAIKNASIINDYEIKNKTIVLK